jgi:putative ATP-binding cassette transporter
MALLASLYRLFGFLVRNTRHVPRAGLMRAGVIAAAVASGLANTALIVIVNQVINAPSPGRSLLVPFLAICLLFPAARFAGDALLISLAEQAVLHLRMTLFSRVLAVPLRTVEEMGSTRLTAVLANDLPAAAAAMALIPLLATNLTLVLGSLAYMGVLSWRMLLCVLAFLALGITAYQLPLLRGRGHVQQFRARGDDLLGHVRVLAEGIKELKLNRGRRADFMERRLRPTALQVQHHAVAAQRAFSAATSWGQVFIFLLIAVVAFALPALGRVERPVLTGFTFAFLYMVGPLQLVLNATAELSRAGVAIGRIEELQRSLAGAARAEPETGPVPEDARSWRSLELQGVKHAYRAEADGMAFTLGPVDLALRPGEIVFITGGNGSGKTTLAKLLAGLYTPESGRVRLDGEPVDEARLEHYRSLFSAVFSDFALFDALPGEAGTALDAEAARYLRLLQLDHRVAVHGGRLSTTDLSRGQRKRLALLSAWLEDRPIYLFDEWAADQDPPFRHLFYHELLPRLRERGKTVFAITHDDRFFHLADRLIRLESGRVVHDSAVQGRILEEPAAGLDFLGHAPRAADSVR